MALHPGVALALAALSLVNLAVSAADFERLEHRTPRAEARLLPGVSRALARLEIAEPISAGDSIGVSIPTARARATLVTPAGVRVTTATAAAAGFRWTSREDVHLGTEEDRGRVVTIEFTRRAPIGTYTIE